MLVELHRGIQTIAGYFGLIRHFGDVLGRKRQADGLLEYLTAMIEPVRAGALEVRARPRTYYAMGKPLFAIKGDRFENHLVSVAGGDSLNTVLKAAGRPGATIDAAVLRRLDPEVIFISSFISNDPKSFCEECKGSGIDVAAVRSGRVHTAPIPTSDFGAPKWVLGLRYLANMLHPERFCFDIESDADAYHRHIFGKAFPLATINRSFAKPNRFWNFEETVSEPCV